jgi:hypothetical protein
MGESVKSRIVARLLELPQPLIGEQKMREIVRKRSVFLLADIKPALWLVTGEEVVLDEDERGYRMTFPVHFKIIIEDQRDACGMADDVVAFLQAKIEADPQLQQLASKVTYNGDFPFTLEELKPDGGSLVTYTVEYRRMRADPNVPY